MLFLRSQINKKYMIGRVKMEKSQGKEDRSGFADSALAVRPVALWAPSETVRRFAPHCETARRLAARLKDKDFSYLAAKASLRA